MPWVKLDAGFPDHPKVVAAGWKAAWLYVCGLTYCARYLTDGTIPKAQLRRLSDIPKPDTEAANLVRAGLWIDDGDTYQVHDYTTWQTPADKIDEIRERGKERARRSYHNRTKNTDSSREDTPKNHKPSSEDSSLEVRSRNRSTSSSSSSDTRHPHTSPEEEEDEATREAKRRLATTPSTINNPDAWIRTTATQLRTNGWTPTPTPTNGTSIYDHPRNTCNTCKGTHWIDNPDNAATVTRCPDCGNG